MKQLTHNQQAALKDFVETLIRLGITDKDHVIKIYWNANQYFLNPIIEELKDESKSIIEELINKKLGRN